MPAKNKQKKAPAEKKAPAKKKAPAPPAVKKPEPTAQSKEESQKVLKSLANRKLVMNFRNFKGLSHIDDIKNGYTVGKQIGQGKFGKIYKGKHKQFKFDCAIKCIEKKLMEGSINSKLIQDEIAIL